MDQIEDKWENVLKENRKDANDAIKALVKFVFQWYDEKKGDPTRNTKFLNRSGEMFSKDSISIRFSFPSEVDETVQSATVNRVFIVATALLSLTGEHELCEVGGTDDIFFSKSPSFQCTVRGDTKNESWDAPWRNLQMESAVSNPSIFSSEQRSTVENLAGRIASTAQTLKAALESKHREIIDLYDNFIDRLKTLFPSLAFVRDTYIIKNNYDYTATTKMAEGWKSSTIMKYSVRFSWEKCAELIIQHLKRLRRLIQSVCIPSINLKTWRSDIILYVLPLPGVKRIPRFTSTVNKRSEASFLRARQTDDPKKHIFKGIPENNLRTFLEVSEKVLADSSHPGYGHVRQLLRSVVENKNTFLWDSKKDAPKSKAAGSAWRSLAAYSMDRWYITCKKTIVKDRKRYEFHFH